MSAHKSDFHRLQGSVRYSLPKATLANQARKRIYDKVMHAFFQYRPGRCNLEGGHRYEWYDFQKDDLTWAWDGQVICSLRLQILDQTCEELTRTWSFRAKNAANQFSNEQSKTESSGEASEYSTRYYDSTITTHDEIHPFVLVPMKCPLTIMPAC